ncbi:hypothetical protein H4R18_001678 [Coemansia javaensis]|uniref:Uncharacterized protein n=1 Tax=Coemansia javaensis TaxID=2761396 RepID=A0A9W8LL08_9FUNG|nr:hypothetical protein H4R18_001678 [Coemansia javaensis]
MFRLGAVLGGRAAAAGRRTLFTTGGGLSGGGWRAPVAAVVAGAGIAMVGFTGYSMLFGAGSVYPSEVRGLLREAGMAYMRPADKQDLPAAAERYAAALALLDRLGERDAAHARDAAHVTGLVARLAAVYTEMGDLDRAIGAHLDLLRRILGDAGMRDAKTQVAQLMDPALPADRRQNILRALGCANALAQAYEARARRSRRRGAVLAGARAAASADMREAGRWYQWCLQLTMLTYQNHHDHAQLEQGRPLGTAPSFDPRTLPRVFSVEIVTSLFYNAAAFFAASGQPDLAGPLLLRALDLLRRGADGTEAAVCRSSVLMSHLANAAVAAGDLPAAEQWAIDGLALARRLPASAECVDSFVALTYGLGAVYEAAARPGPARVQYRTALDAARAVGDDAAAELARAALARVPGAI